MSIITAMSVTPDEREYVRCMMVSIQRNNVIPYEHYFMSEAAFNQWVANGLAEDARPNDQILHDAFAAMGNDFDGKQGLTRRPGITLKQFFAMAENMDRPLAVKPKAGRLEALLEMHEGDDEPMYSPA